MTTIACPSCLSILESAEPLQPGEPLECPGCGVSFPAPAAARRLAVAAGPADTRSLPRPPPIIHPPPRPKGAESGAAIMVLWRLGCLGVAVLCGLGGFLFPPLWLLGVVAFVLGLTITKFS